MSPCASHSVVELRRVLQSRQVKHCAWKRWPAARTSSASYTDLEQRGHLGAPEPSIATADDGRVGEEGEEEQKG